MFNETKSPGIYLSSTPNTPLSRRRMLQLVAGSSVAIVGGGILAACSNNQSSGESKVELISAGWPFEAMPSAEQQKKDPTLKAYAGTLDNWLKKNPGVSIKKSALNIWDQSQLTTAVSAGTAPTWYQGNVLGGWNDSTTRSAFTRGLAADLTTLVTKYNIDKKLTRGAIEPYKRWAIEGKYYSVPTDYIPASMGIYFRRDLFGKAGIEEPQADWTWEDVRKAAKVLAVDKRKGLTAQSWVVSGIRDAEQLSLFGTLPSPNTGWHWRSDYVTYLKEWEQATAIWRGMYFSDKSLSSDATYTDSAVVAQFVNGNTGMFLNGSSFFTRPATDETSLASFAKKKLNKTLDETVGYVSLPRGINGAPTTTQSFVPQLSIDPRLQRNKDALDKAISLYDYMSFGAGYVDQKKAIYASTKDLQSVFTSAIPMNDMFTIEGIPGSLEDAWGKKFMASAKLCNDIPLIPNKAWYFPPEKNPGPTGTADNDANSALAFTQKDVASIVKNLEQVSNKDAAGFTSSTDQTTFKKAAREYYAACNSYYQQHAAEFHSKVFAPWYEQKIVPVIGA